MIRLFTRLILVVGLGLACLGSVRGQGSGNWVRPIQGLPSQLGAQSIRDVAVDGAGNVYVVGSYSGTTNFGGTILTSVAPSSGSYDSFIAKYSPQGALLWVRQANDIDIDEASCIALGPGGQVYVAGYFASSLSIGVTILTGANGVNSTMYLACYDAQGNLLWARQPLPTGEYATALAVDSAGNLYLTGANRPAQADGRACIAKLDNQGNLLWQREATGNSRSYGSGLGLDASGNVYVTGLYEGAMSFGTTPLPTGTGQLGPGYYIYYENTFFTKYTSQGVLQWATGTGGGATGNYTTAIAVAADGSSYAVGNFSQRVAFGTQLLINSSAGPADFVVKHDAQGNALWARAVASNGGYLGFQKAKLDGTGQLYVAGGLSGSTTFGSQVLTSTPGAAYAQDILLVKYDAQGTITGARNIGGTTSELCSALAATSTGDVVLAGNITRGMSNLVGVGLQVQCRADAYILKLDGAAALSTRSRTNSSNLALHPNPATAGQPLRLTLATATAGTVRLLNTLGQTVRTQPLTAGNAVLDVAGLAAGRYVVQVQTPTELLTRSVIIK